MAGERFNREAGKPWLAEAPPADSPVETELETSELLTRLGGRLRSPAASTGAFRRWSRAFKAERDARRRLAETLKRERSATAAIHEQAQLDREAHAATREELERLREGAAVAELHFQQYWARLADAEGRLAMHERGFWRKLFRRPPAG